MVLSLVTAALAQTPPVDVVIETYRAEYTVHPDGTYTALIRTVNRLLTPNGVQQAAQASMIYSESLQSLEVLEAYTLKADGTRVVVPEDSIYVQSPPETQEAPAFTDNKVVTVVFPQVAVGDAVSVTWKLTQREPFFPGAFYTTDLEPIAAVVEEATIVVDYPAAMPLTWAQRGGYRVQEEAHGDRKRLIATFSRTEPLPPEPGMVDPAQVSPALVITSFTDWEAVGAAYWARARDKAEVTPEIAALAEEVAGDAEGLEAARRLYDWVTRNIRYVALELGVGGYVPQPAAQVLEQRYADCKGYVALLQALLKAKGVRAVPVLIRAGEDYGLLPAPTPEQFNHAILYLPDYGVYLDPTVRYAPFGVLPLADLSKPVVLAGDAPRLTRTPSGNPKRDAYHQFTRFTLTENGELEGQATIQASGYVDAQYRVIFAQLPQVAYPQIVQGFLAQFGEGGSGEMRVSPLEDLDQPFTLEARWKSPRVAQPGETLTLGRLPVGFALFPLDQLKTYAAPKTRRFPVSVGAFSARYEVRLELPEGYAPLLLPKGAALQNEAGRFTSRYALEDGALVAMLDLELSRDVYPPEAYPALKALIETAVGNVQQPVVLQQQP